MMVHFIIRWVVLAVSLYLTFWTGQAIGLDMKPSEQWQENMIMAAILGLVNALIKPILNLLLIPANCLTFGIAGIIINSLLFWLLFTVIQTGFHIGNFWAALYGSIAISVINSVLSVLIPEEKRDS